MKRYTFEGQPFNDRILEAISPELNLDYSSLKEDWDPLSKDKYAYTFKNQFIFKEGIYNLQYFMALGFLLCAHPDRRSQQEEFWRLINFVAKARQD